MQTNLADFIKHTQEGQEADADLEKETKPEDVLAEIERLQRRAMSLPRKSPKLR